jgi:hypothetical protein
MTDNLDALWTLPGVQLQNSGNPTRNPNISVKKSLYEDFSKNQNVLPLCYKVYIFHSLNALATIYDFLPILEAFLHKI